MRMTGILAIGAVILASEMCLADEPHAPTDSHPPALVVPPASPADCHGCGRGELHWHSFLAWALYHPPAKYCCNCLPKTVPCCTPPLYTWFPCQGFGDCGPEGCTSCGEAAGPCKSECSRLFHRGKE
jgi:hypothetical protein